MGLLDVVVCQVVAMFPQGYGLLTMVDGQLWMHDSCFMWSMREKETNRRTQLHL